MTNRKFSRKRIGQALGLLMLSLALLVGSSGYGQQPTIRAIPFFVTTTAQGSLRAAVPTLDNKVIVDFKQVKDRPNHALLLSVPLAVCVVVELNLTSTDIFSFKGIEVQSYVRGAIGPLDVPICPGDFFREAQARSSRRWRLSTTPHPLC